MWYLTEGSSPGFCDKDGCVGIVEKGHLKRFGEHRPSEGEIASLKYAPSGADFYHNYIHKRKPVVIRNGANHWPAVQLWQNESYLASNFGSNIFTVEYRKKFKNEHPVRKPLSFGEFLKIYKSEDVYLDSAFPPNSPMLNDIILPSVLNCHEISSSIDSLNLLFNSGDANSAFHHDGLENIITVISGTKTVYLINSTYGKELYADQFTIAPGVLSIDPEKLDLETYPKLADVPYYEVTLNKGDMLYIPQYWWHIVRSHDAPNIALNVWFAMFNFEKQFLEAGISEDTDVTKVTEMFDKLVQDEPDRIQCQEEKHALNAILKINASDPSSGPLRIPKRNERPADVKLASGYTMPVMGFGTATLMENTTTAVKAALEVGYRLIDTAQGYPGSEPLVAEAIEQSGIPRSDIFILTKLHPKYLGYDTTLVAIEMSLQSLKTDYIDLFLIHTQQCDDFLLTCEEGEPKGTWQESWKAMEEMQKKGKLRSLGVSNFDTQDLEELVQLATVPVSAVQNWFDPFHQDRPVRKFCQEHNIRYIGYSTLGLQWVYFHGLQKNPVLSSSLILEIASHYEFVPSQVVLRWAIHVNVTVIPRSKNPRNIYLNFRALDFSLNEDEIEYFNNITDYEFHPLEQKLEKGLGCSDKHSNCQQWASSGECRSNPDWMLINCQESCGLCYDEDLSGDSSVEPLVFVGSEDHNMYALSAASGTVIWKYRTLGKIMSSAALSQDEEIVYFGSNDGNVYALGAANGSVVWTLKTEGAVVASPRVGLDGTVYVGSQDKHVYALNGKTGSVLWKTDLHCPIWGAVAVDNEKGLLFTGCTSDKSNASDSQDTPHVFALKASSGEIAWKFDRAGSVYGSPALMPGGQTVFFATLDHNIYALDRESGKLYWSHDTGSEVESSPVVSKLDGTLYVGLIKDQLIAVNTIDGPLAGKVKWTVNTGGEVVSSPVITEDGRVFVGSGDGRILALKQTDGSHIWSPTTRDYVVASVAVSRDNVVYAASSDKFVYALHGDDGSVIWKFETGAGVVATPVLFPEHAMPVG
ncbi:hypothetical protein ACROYT_G023866 [Oculina patagonica]